MKVLVLNSGSSSIKYQLFRTEDWSAIASGVVARIGESEGELRLGWLDAGGQRQEERATRAIADHQAGIDQILSALREQGALGAVEELLAIGHRVVHGGPDFSRPVIIDDGVVAKLRALIPLAPLHNPGHLAGIEVARALFPQVPSVAVFDTAFHQSMPPSAYRYAIPEALYNEQRIRRYGFHGTSHHYVAKRAAAVLGRALEQCNLITLHLGNGSSVTAIRNGRCLDTSMGLTPLEGLVMGTRSGDIDPGVLIYLTQHLGYDAAALDHLLNRESGLLGLCGVNDMREVGQRAAAGDARAALALDVMVHRLRKYIGAYYALLGRVDALVFTGGIGENDRVLRERACADLDALGIQLDPEANGGDAQGERSIASTDSGVELLVIPTNEELEIARQAVETVEPGAQACR